MKKYLVLTGVISILLGVSTIASAMDFGTITAHGLVLTPASIAGGAGLNVPAGTAPTSPANGDMWTTSAGLYIRINGATVGPLIDSSGAGSGTVTEVTATGPLNVATGTTTPALTIDNAAADGSTKGAASFTAADFDSTTGNISIDYTNGQAAATAAKGFLTAADWNTFNGKQDTITPANLTETTSSILTITGGTGATLEGVTIAVTKADTTNSGYLDTTDWDTFNDKASTTAPTFATSVTGSYLTASEMLITGADKKIISAPVATYPSLAELAYVKGLTSAVQTQLNAKADVYSTTFVDGDLAAGVLTVTHNLGTKLVSVTVFNNDDQICWPDLVTLSSTSACAVDLSSYGTLVGTWGVRAAE